MAGGFRRPKSFDIDKACTWARRNATAKSRGICATNVKMAMQAGGIPYIGGYNGCDMDRYCINYGMKQVNIKVNGKNPTGIQKGDVASMKHGKYGHTCIYDGRNWISDFMQNNCVPYTSGWKDLTVWRWTDNPVYSGYDYNIPMASADSPGDSGGGGGDAQLNNYRTISSSGRGNIFNSGGSGENSFTLAGTNKNKAASDTNNTHTRVYSTNDATIVLDELSLPTDPTEATRHKDVSTNTSTNS